MSAPRTQTNEVVQRTVAYMTAIGYPVTVTDVWQWQMGGSDVRTLREVDEAVAALVTNGTCSRHEGRVVLKGHETLFERVLHASRIAERKFRVAKRYARFLRWIPSVRGVAVCNSLAWEMTHEESDIDLFVIVRGRALWFVRFFALLPAALLGRRPGQSSRDPVCLSFFLSDGALGLHDVALTPTDPHFAHWLLSMVPLVDDGVFADFFNANAWARVLFPNTSPVRLAWFRRLRRAQPTCKTALLWLDHVLGQIQQRHLPSVIRVKQHEPTTDVIINDRMLKFHTNDRRLAYRTMFESLCSTP